MMVSRIGIVVAVAILAGCQETSAPTEFAASPDAVSSSAERSDRAGEVAGDWLFRFERMVGNDVTGAAGAIRGQNAGGVPWRLERGEARLSQRGELRVEVRGLVLQATGVNPVPQFKAILSCLTNSAGTLATVNISTTPVDVGPEGDARIREVLSGIPSPCYAPIVLVTSATGAWFAVSGF